MYGHSRGYGKSPQQRKANVTNCQAIDGYVSDRGNLIRSMRTAAIVEELIGLPARAAVRGELGDPHPEVLDGPHDSRKLLNISGFCHIAVGVELIAADDILFRIGSGQDDDGNTIQAGILAHLQQDFAAIHLGHIEVQQDEFRPGHPGIPTLLPEEGQALLSIRDDMEIDAHSGLMQGVAGQPHVRGVVLHQEHFNSSLLGLWLFGHESIHEELPFQVPALPPES